MTAKTIAFALALPLSAALAPALAAGSTTTLDQVNALPRTEVRVGCDTAMWPTLRQVSRHTGRTQDEASALRGKILREGRRACALGSTHVLLVFNPAGHTQDAVAVR
jgi:hypothetical protein